MGEGNIETFCRVAINCGPNETATQNFMHFAPLWYLFSQHYTRFPLL